MIGDDHNSWEPADHLLRTECVKEYWESRRAELDTAVDQVVAPGKEKGKPARALARRRRAAAGDDDEEEELNGAGAPKPEGLIREGTIPYRHLQLLRAWCTDRGIEEDRWIDLPCANDYRGESFITDEVIDKMYQLALGAVGDGGRKRKLPAKMRE